MNKLNRPMTKSALDSGKSYNVAGTNYMGQNPIYKEFGMPPQMMRVGKGIPWVNVDKLTKR